MTSASSHPVVVSTRLEDPTGAFAVRLSSARVTVHSVPVLVWVPGPDLGAFRAAVARLNDHGAVVFTSRRAVDAAWACDEWRRAWNAASPRPKIAAVGRVTAERLGYYGVNVDIMPAVPGGAALADALLAERDIEPNRVLWPRALEARDDVAMKLTQAGVPIDMFAVYRTLSAAPEQVRVLQVILEQEARATVCFFSPSAVRSVVEAFGDERARDVLAPARVGSLGPSTSQALRGAGIEPCLQASRADAGVFAEEVLQAFGRRGSEK